MSEQIESMEPEFNWDVKELKRRNWKNVYKRGFKSYISLVVIIFVFSFIGSVSVLSSGSVHTLETWGKLFPSSSLPCYIYP